MKRWMVAAVCLWCCGCLVDAGKLAGITEPGISYERKWSGSKFNISSDMAMQEGLFRRNKDTGEMELHVVGLSSAASPVTLAQGERAEHLAELRRIEAQVIGMQLQAMSGLFDAVLKMLPAMVVPAPSTTSAPSGTKELDPALIELLRDFLMSRRPVVGPEPPSPVLPQNPT